ncbi:hypothetical protein B0H13DRAFT_1589881, partial [Mycena leptocephala]
GAREIMRLLLERSSNVSPHTGFSYDNALALTSYSGNTDIVWLLLKSGADVNLPTGTNGNALILASERGHIEAVRLLLENGADVKAQCSRTVRAALGWHSKVIQFDLLREYGAA